MLIICLRDRNALKLKIPEELIISLKFSKACRDVFSSVGFWDLIIGISLHQTI